MRTLEGKGLTSSLSLVYVTKGSSYCRLGGGAAVRGDVRVAGVDQRVGLERAGAGEKSRGTSAAQELTERRSGRKAPRRRGIGQTFSGSEVSRTRARTCSFAIG